jgi:hypothetical protein
MLSNSGVQKIRSAGAEDSPGEANFVFEYAITPLLYK